MLRSGSDRPSTTIQEMLHSVGMRATVQRIALARLLLRSKNRRVTTEILYNEALERGALFQGAPCATRCASSSGRIC